MSAKDIKMLAALDRAIETLTERREAAAKRLAVVANEFRRATISDKDGIWRRNLRHNSSLCVAALNSTDNVLRVKVHSTLLSRSDGSEEHISDVMPLAYLEGTMSLGDAIAPILAAQQREAEKLAAATRAAELEMLAKLQAKYR